MSEFSNESHPFDGGYIPDHPDNAHTEYGSHGDPMAPPDFYPGQADHPEARLEDMDPATTATKDRLVDDIKFASTLGTRLMPFELPPDSGNWRGYEWYSAMRQPSDGNGRIDVDYYPPQDTPARRGIPEEATVRFIDTADPREDTLVTSYKAVKLPDGWRVEKSVVIQEAPMKSALGSYNRITAALDPAAAVDDIEAELAAAAHERALGTTFVSEQEALEVIRRLHDSTPISEPS